MSGFVKTIVLPAVLITAGFAAIVPLNGYVSAHKPALPESYDDSDLTLRGSKLRGFALGTEGLLADWYWMRSLQYIGDKMVKHGNEDINLDDLRSLDPRLLYPLLNNATDLDPHFIAAYSYGAIVLPAIDPGQAIAIAKKGIANNPQEFRLYQHLGYIYWKLKRYDDAADAYEKGAETENAPPFMRLMAAAMKTEGGGRSTARQIFQQMYDGTDDDAVKITAGRRLQELEALDELDAINAKLNEYKLRNERCVGTLGEIVPALQSVQLPAGDFRIDNANKLVDPSGTPYVLDKQNCHADLDRQNTGVQLEK